MEQVYLRSSAPAPTPRRAGGAEKDLLQAAKRGDADAQCNLGILYANGVDDNGRAVEGNRPEAVKWLLASAEQGLPRAQVKLAEVYAAAPDISGSHIAACGWFLVAAAGSRGIHLQRAETGYERIALRLSAAQIAKARVFVRNWTVKRPKRVANLASGKNLLEGGAP
jgi:TPR repeat protein